MVNWFYPTSSFIDYKADVEAPLPMIYQSGYLTIKDWNMDTDSYLLDFPNDEVRSGFLTLVKAAKRRSGRLCGRDAELYLHLRIQA